MPAWLRGVSRRQHALFLVILSRPLPPLSFSFPRKFFAEERNSGVMFITCDALLVWNCTAHLSRVKTAAALLDDREEGVELGAAKIWKYY